MEFVHLDPSQYWRRRFNPARDILLAFIRGFIGFLSTSNPNPVGLLADVVVFAKEVIDLAEKLPKLNVGEQIVIADPGIQSTAQASGTTPPPVAPTGEGDQSMGSRRQKISRRRRPTRASTRMPVLRYSTQPGSRSAPPAAASPTPASCRAAFSTAPGTSANARIVTARQAAKRKLWPKSVLVDLETSSDSSIVSAKDLGSDSCSPIHSLPLIDSDNDSEQNLAPLVDQAAEDPIDNLNMSPLVDFETEPSAASEFDLGPFSAFQNGGGMQGSLQSGVGSDDNEAMGYTAPSFNESDLDLFSDPSSPSQPKAPKMCRYSPYTPVSDDSDDDD